MHRIIWWGAATACVIGAIYLLPVLLGAFLSTDTPTAVVVSRSMWPALDRGDIVFIKETSPEEIKVGTILVFHHGSGLAIHRVVHLDGDTIVTKGDANRTVDSPITFDDVVGRLPTLWGRDLVIPWLGQVALSGRSDEPPPQGEPLDDTPGVLRGFSTLVGNPLGFLLFLVVPTGLVAAAFFSEIFPLVAPGRRKRRWRQKRLERLRKRWPRARLVYR